MGLTRLGALISRSNVRNDGGEYGIDDVRGMSVEKKFIPTKADMRGVSLRPYKVVRPKWFSYVTVTSRNSDKLTLAYNDSGETYLVSGTYEVFSVANEDQLDPRYLFLLINRGEFDRLARFNSWGSARETLSWEDFCDIELDLPPIEIQRKYAAVYESMLVNQRSYERGLDDLRLSIGALYDRCKHDCSTAGLGELLVEVDARNDSDLPVEPLGVTLDQRFQPSRGQLKERKKYKRVAPGQIVANLIQIGRDAAFPISMNDTDDDLLVSPDYHVFQPKDTNTARYLMGWFSRSEVGRYGWFICDDGVRGRLSIEKFNEMQIPYPSKKTLHTVAGLQAAYKTRSDINERLKAQLKSICPILIRGSIEEASR